MRPFSRATLVLLALSVLCTPEQGHADDLDTLNIIARQAYLYDSNIFRSSGLNSANPVRSDTLSMSVLGLTLDKRYSLQRVELDANVTSYRYRRTTYLDFNALNYRGVWHWSLTPRLYGTLRRTQSERLNTYDYFEGGPRRNIGTDRLTGGSVEAVLGRDWRLLGGLERETRSNEQPIAEQGDYSLRRLSTGLRYLFPSGSSISYRLLDVRGDYQNRVPGVSLSPNTFDQGQHELQFRWSVSEKTTVDARIGHLSREHPGYADRNFSGIVGDVEMDWAPTGKLRFQAIATRRLTSNLSNTASYLSSTRFVFNSFWSITSRTVLSAGFDQTRNDFEGALPGFADENREDTINSVRLGLRWTPLNQVSVGTGIQRTRRTSNIYGAGYVNNSATLDATLRF
jgi:exopolysaccharide biosynthesis operon protein EpsL